jgi:hypothetical protein
MQGVFLKMNIYILNLISPRVRSYHLSLPGVECHWKPSEIIKEKLLYSRNIILHRYANKLERIKGKSDIAAQYSRCW